MLVSYNIHVDMSGDLGWGFSEVGIVAFSISGMY